MRAPARAELNCQIIVNIYFGVDRLVSVWYNTIEDKERRVTMYVFAGAMLLGIYLAAGAIGLGFIGIILAVIVTSIIGIVEDKGRR